MHRNRSVANPRLTASILMAAALVCCGVHAADPSRAIELRQQSVGPVDAAERLSRAGIREAQDIARVLIAADYAPRDVERTLTSRFRLPSNVSVDLVRRALNDHVAIAGGSTLRRNVCYLANGSLVQCPLPPMEATSTDPTVLELSQRLALVTAAAEDTALRQALAIRDLQRRLYEGDLVERVGGEHHFSVARSAFHAVEHDDHDHVAGSRMVEVGGSQHLTVGGHVREHIGGSLSTAVFGALGLRAENGVVIEAHQQISLKAGGHFITIGPNGIQQSSASQLGGSAGSHSHGQPARPSPPATP
jgi:hypothetical protein